MTSESFHLHLAPSTWCPFREGSSVAIGRSIAALIGICCAAGPSFSSDFCDTLANIRVLPFKGEHVNDEAYNQLVNAKDAAIPCLIAKLTDTTPTQDPRQAPVTETIAIGDVALFVLEDITRVPLEQMLPGPVKEEFKRSGIYAYFQFVKDPGNRRVFQASWREWYANKVNYGKP